MIFFDSNLNGSISLPQSQHLFSCRVKVQQQVRLSNLKGGLVEAEIIKVDKQNHTINYKIIDKQSFEPAPEKILFQAITDKNYLEKMVEIIPIIGVSKVILFQSQFSPKQNFSVDRLQSIMIRSCEQAENLFLPQVQIVSESDLLQLLKQHKPQLLDIYGDCKPLKSESISSVLVGPEGGFGSQEISQFEALGLQKVSFGSSVLPAWLAGYSYFCSIL